MTSITNNGPMSLLAKALFTDGIDLVLLTHLSSLIPSLVSYKHA